MIASPIETEREAKSAFDSLASEYDEVFSRSSIGRAQRNVVWRHAKKVFAAGNHILELNCGTGEDVLYLAQLDISVTACDASVQMIECAKRRQRLEAPAAAIVFKVLPSGKIW